MSNPSILNNITKYVENELNKDSIPKDAKWVIVGTADNNGTKLLGAVNIHKGVKTDLKVAAVWEHDWDGDDTGAIKLIFVGK